MKRKYTFSKWMGFTLVFGILAVMLSLRSTSLWPDEGLTYKVISKGFADFIRSMADLSAGSAQCGMPLYMCFEWAWIRVFGNSELAMRASNLILMLPYLFFSGKAIRKMGLSAWYMALFALNSVFLFYINDARPYTMLVSMGMAFFYYAMLGNLNDRSALAKMHICFFVGIASHMMFLFIYFAYLTRCIFLIRRGELQLRVQMRFMLRFMPFYLLLAAYYGYVFINAQEINAQGANPVMCIAQICYYLGGFGGLGLNRHLLRDALFSRFEIEHMVLLGLMLVAYAGMLIYTLTEFRHAKREKPASDNVCDHPDFLQLMCCFLSAMVLFLLGNTIAGTLFWERHCIWILPFILMLLCMLLDGMLHSGKKVFRVCAVLMIVMQLLSAGRATLDPYYGKEDYKGVAAWFAQLGEDQSYTLLFQGSESAFRYYGWEDGKNSSAQLSPVRNIPDEMVMINNWSVEDIENKISQSPGLYYLVLSQKERFDIHDIYNCYDGNTDFHTFKIVRIESNAA